ncbi:MAG: rhomboid family intramembrane serine protease [Acidimicrobiales bacterium]
MVVQTIMGICVLAFLAQMLTNDAVTRDGWLWGPAVASGEWWRIITSGFLHGSLLHIGFNMYALYLFGEVLEPSIGRLRFVLVYAGGLVGGSLAVLAFNFPQATLGASGAVLGLAGAMAGILAAQGRSIFQTGLGGIFLINLLLPLLPGVGISFWGHFGGIAGGFLVGGVLTAAHRTFASDPKVMRMATGMAAALVVAMFVAAVAVARAGGIVAINI